MWVATRPPRVGSLSLLCLAVLLCTPLAISSEPAGLFARLFGATEVTAVADDTGGSNCGACSILVGVVEQLAEYHNASVDAYMENLCMWIPSEAAQAGCRLLISTYGPEIIAALENKETPDIVCHTLGLCKTPSGTPMCHVFPLPSRFQGDPIGLSRHVEHRRRQYLNRQQQSGAVTGGGVGKTPAWCKWPGIEEICNIIDAWTGDHLPVEDRDGDRFSTFPSARGTAWRGKDCDDANKNIYPGRRTPDGDANTDSNCNGIYGVDATTGKSYEDLWCNGTQRYGTAVLGDSIGAHFHIPRAWMNVTEMDEESFSNLFYILTNEMDWPELSTATGHSNATKWPEEVHGPMDSLYQRLFTQNHCNHRDYQNVAVNGARATAMNSTIVRSLARRQDADQPLLIMLELVGNDVCSGHPGTSHMTPPEVYHDAQLATLRYLDTILPAGSHILLVGLVDGRFLYDHMHARIHPLGALRHDVTYTDVYGYLECLGVTPCWGWLNSNGSARNATTAHAELLNAELKKIADNETFKNFDVLYSVYNITEAAEIAKTMGKQPWELIEPIDGFHANQLGNALTTRVLWELFEKEKPAWIPALNPHNADILSKFRNQGGY